MLKPAPLAAAPRTALAAVRGVLTDIDDTLTRDGAIEGVALAALHALADAGLPVVAITGRPLGWSEPFAAAWPVRAIVAENGAVALLREGSALQTEFVQDATTRAANAQRLQAVAAQIVADVPGAVLARDSAGRATDIAIDHSEFTTLPQAAIDQVVATMRAAGLEATVSSIHINGWIGSHSKWTGAQWIVQRLLGIDLAADRGRWLYVGDSMNDQVVFEQLPLTVGVANLRRFAAQLHSWPAYLTRAERGEGFAEVARALLLARD